MGSVIYALCALTSLACAGLLFRAYRANRTRLLLFSTLCFVGLALNNVLMFVDLVVVTDAIDLAYARAATALVAVGLLVLGLVWEGV